MNADELKQQYEPHPAGTALDCERQLWHARYTPSGKFLVGCGYDAQVYRWNVAAEEAQALPPLKGHNGWVQSIDFVPAENAEAPQVAITADSWGGLIAWPIEADTPEPLWQRADAHNGWIRAVAVSPDGKLVATGGNDLTVRLWSTADGSPQGELAHPERVFSLTFHPTDGTLVSGDLKGTLRQWNVAEGKELRTLDASVLYQLSRIQECGGARHLSFDGEGRYLACAGQKNPQGGFATGIPCVLVFDFASGKLVREMPMGGTQDGFAYDARFHPAGFVMCTSGAFPGKGHVWFWRPEDEKPFFSGNKIPNGRSLSLHPDGERLALLVSLAPNGNGRNLKDGVYQGGSAKVHFLRFGKAEQPAAG